MPCTVRYVTTDCLHTQLWWGTKAKFTEVTQSAAKQPPFRRKNNRPKRQTCLNNNNNVNNCIYPHYANKFKTFKLEGCNV